MPTSPASISADSGDWSPQQYGKFAAERAQPFHDLLGLIEPATIERGVDLGCGPGDLTALAAQKLRVGAMLGIDNSTAMLEEAGAHADSRTKPSVEFADGDIGRWTSDRDFDLVLANASLQWLPDHAAVLRAWTAALRPGGQLAVQVPANASMPSHLVADQVAHTEPFLSAFGPAGPPPDPVAENVLDPEMYASVLHDLGFTRQHVRLQIYPHVLESSRTVVEWVRGTTLTRFQKRLAPPTFAAFVTEYERALLARIGEHTPYFFAFRRILMWGRLPG